MRPELDGRAVVLFAESARCGLQVVVCSREATGQGVEPGMPMAEARALLERTAGSSAGNTPHFERHDPQEDERALRALARWCRRFSPRVGIEEAERPDSLFLDITGCAHLFGGERRLADEVVRAFDRRGLIVRIAMADTMGAAWATVRFGRVSPTIVPPGRQEEWLRAFPVEALRLAPECIRRLHDLGLRQIGQLEALPRDGLPSRFGPDLLRRLDQAMGRLPESIVPERPPESVEARWTFEDPATDRRVVADVLERLLQRILDELQPRRRGIQRLLCRFGVTDRSPVHVSLELLQPSVSKKYIMELLHMQLERQTVGPEVSEVLLRATATAPLSSRQKRLFDHGAEAKESKLLVRLLERISHRLGLQAVLSPQPVPEAQPERACRFVPTLRAGRRPRKTGRSVPHTACFRPLRLFPKPVPVRVVSVYPAGPPIRFCQDGRDHHVLRWWGPERIETGWWRRTPVRRDYYRVETTTGHRWWLFRRIEEGDWFLHGAFE